MTSTSQRSSIETISHGGRCFPPPESFSKKSRLGDLKLYEKFYRQSIQDPEGFWGEMAKDFVWLKPWEKVLSYDWTNTHSTRWFEGASTNITLNALDRHLKKNGDRLAFLWVGNEPGTEKRISYSDLHRDVGRFANVLKSVGVKRGDRVSIYLPMIPELPVAMLACARIGAIHSVIFGGFSAEALKDRILDCDSRVLITADGGFRGPKKIPLKEIADRSMDLVSNAGRPIQTCLVVKRTGDTIPMKNGRDLWVTDLLETASPICKAEEMDAEDPLFILYTSGSTGKPKGVLHTTAGYMVYAATTFRYVFDYPVENPSPPLYWCTADIGWITGHSYMVYGPLCEGASSILFEGIPNYPAPDRLWEIVERYRVSILYTAPTAIRALMREGDTWPKKHNLTSLRLLGSVGEPINPEAWMWYYEKIGREQCPIVDTWWQTETGGILITPLPGAMTLKPGSASRPFFGVEPAIFRDDGSECDPGEGGLLVIKKPWPGIMRTVYGHHERFQETYFSRFPGVYLTGDGAHRDKDGDYWIVGRIDDVLKVSGHRIGTAEVESALVSHPAVAEAAVVGIPHEIKGEGIYAFVTLKTASEHEPERIHSGRLSGASDLSTIQPMGVSGGESFDRLSPSTVLRVVSLSNQMLSGVEAQDLTLTLRNHVRNEVGPIAVPDTIQFAPALPKTRSGKIMRRILRKIAAGQVEDIGDTTTLADPSVVNDLIRGRN